MGINMGNGFIYAIGGVVDEEHEKQHHKVMLESTRRGDARSFLMVNSATIFDAVKAKGIVFSGPAPFDREGRCMRFMFEKDAKAFYEAFKRVETPDEWAERFMRDNPEGAAKLVHRMDLIRGATSQTHLDAITRGDYD